MSFGGPLGWRSSSSSNPRLAGLSKPSSSSNRLSLASASPISRSLTSLGGSLGGSAVDQYIASAASSSYASSPSHRRSPHVRRSSQQPSVSNRLRASSHTNLSSLSNNSLSSQAFATPTNQSRSRVSTGRPVSNASSTTSLNSARSGYDTEDNRSRASSVHSVDSVDGTQPDKSHSARGQSNIDSSLTSNNVRGSTVSLSESDLKAIQSGTSVSDEIDYKKLCKQLIRENETLRRRIKELEEAEKKRDQEFSREKRSLQRTISEHEEELKAMNDIKADNVRLKDENGALIRVISKLSK